MEQNTTVTTSELKGGSVNMATSSIFHNVVLIDPKEVEDFLTALKASEADTYASSGISLSEVMMTKEDILRLHEL